MRCSEFPSFRVSEPPWPHCGLLIDNSAWSRARLPPVREAWKQALESRRLVSCPPFLIEVGYSARTGAELRETRADIALSMATVPCTEATWDLAFDAQQRMADASGLMHRRKPIDFLVAAIAHQHGLGVLHYDRDYDLIAEHSGLRFASVWVVPAGTADR